MPQRLTDVPELHGKYTTFFLFGLEKGKKKYFILYLSYRLSFVLRFSTQKLPFIATSLAC